MRKFLSCEFQVTQHAPHLTRGFCERNTFRMRTSFNRSTGSTPFVANDQRTTSRRTSGTKTQQTLCNRVSACPPALAPALSQGSPPPFAVMRKSVVRSIGSRPFVGNVQRATSLCHAGNETLHKRASSTRLSALHTALPPLSSGERINVHITVCAGNEKGETHHCV